MPACSAFGCTNRPSKKTSGITFHRFPLKTEKRQAWILACGRKNWWPSKYSVLCSKHFSEDQIDRTSQSSVRLRDNAVPNIFPGYPSYLKNIKLTVPAKKNVDVTPKEPETSAMASKLTLRKIAVLKNGVFVFENDNTFTPLPALDKSVLGNQPTLGTAQAAMHLDSTDSAPTSTEGDHENETLQQTLDNFDGRIFKCYKINKDPATSIMTRETAPRKIIMSENGKLVLENDHMITVGPMCYPASDESALVSRIAGALESTDSVSIKCYRDAATSPIRDYENEILNQKIEKLEDTVDKFRKKIKVLQQSNRRAKKRALRYKNLYEVLMKRKPSRDAIESLSNSTSSSDSNEESLLKQPINLETKKYVCYVHNLRNES